MDKDTKYSFFQEVYDLVRLVPPGRVTTYGAIASCLGSRKSARMVGWALNHCHHVRPPVPAHRVVNRKGLLTGQHHFLPHEPMKTLLLKEGIHVRDHQVLNFDALFWNPLNELSDI